MCAYRRMYSFKNTQRMIFFHASRVCIFFLRRMGEERRRGDLCSAVNCGRVRYLLLYNFLCLFWHFVVYFNWVDDIRKLIFWNIFHFNLYKYYKDERFDYLFALNRLQNYWFDLKNNFYRSFVRFTNMRYNTFANNFFRGFVWKLRDLVKCLRFGNFTKSEVNV